MASVNGDVETYDFTSYWRVENFNFTPGNDFSIESPEFKIKTLKSKWCIEIEEKGDYLAAYLCKKTNPTRCLIHFSLSLLKGTSWIPISSNVHYRFKVGDGYGTGQMISLKNLKEEKWIYLPNGTLTISFRIWNKMNTNSTQCLMISRLENENNLWHKPVEYLSSLKPNDLHSLPSSYQLNSNGGIFNVRDQEAKEFKNELTQTDSNAFKDAEDLLRLFKEKDFSFVTLRTSNRDFSVHKAVLCSKSPVFNAMFEGQMKENDTHLVDIDDIDSQTMVLLVNFLHFQPIKDLKWEAAVTLYYAADKYQIESLKKECVGFIKKELSVENICDTLLLADLHQDKVLMNHAQEYFCQNSKLILTSKSWKDFLSHTELVSEVLYKLAEKM